MTNLETIDFAALSTVSGGQQAASWTNTASTWANNAWTGAKAGAQAAWNNAGTWAQGANWNRK